MMTPAYASPEQLHSQPATAASDVYSLGVLLCEVLTGRRPERFGTSGSVDASSAILTGGLENILAKAMREEPGERYLSVGDLAADVRRHLAGQPISAGPYSAPSVHTGQEADRSTGPKSIAVLPFQALGAADRSEEYLGVGMADALITKLSNIRRLVVPAYQLRSPLRPRALWMCIMFSTGASGVSETASASLSNWYEDRTAHRSGRPNSTKNSPIFWTSRIRSRNSSRRPSFTG
jgi:serine/threonine protein kinase